MAHRCPPGLLGAGAPAQRSGAASGAEGDRGVSGRPGGMVGCTMAELPGGDRLMLVDVNRLMMFNRC